MASSTRTAPKVDPPLLVYPPKLHDLETNPGHIQFAFHKRDSPYNSSPIQTISLYMPQAVSQPSTVSWSSGKLGFVGNTAVSILRSSGLGTAIGNAANGSFDFSGVGMPTNIDGLWKNAAQIAGLRGAGELLSAAVKLGGGSATAEDLIGASTGMTFNPYLTMLFQGVSFRNFSFTFKFVPFEPEDCDRIDEIITAFRKFALPEGRAAKNPDAGPFLKYPGECDIKYLWRDKENKYLHKFTRSVCTGVNVDYTGQGMFAVMRNGMPANITLTTSWSEINLVLAGDVEDGY